MVEYLADNQSTADGLPVVITELPAGGRSNVCMYVMGDTTPLFQQPTGTCGPALWYHDDGVSCVRATTNSSGQIANSYNYSVYDTLKQNSVTISNTYKFTKR